MADRSARPHPRKHFARDNSVTSPENRAISRTATLLTSDQPLAAVGDATNRVRTSDPRAVVDRDPVEIGYHGGTVG
jgi:hypothetical protein